MLACVLWKKVLQMHKRDVEAPSKGSRPETLSGQRVAFVLLCACLVLQFMLAHAVFHHSHELCTVGNGADCVACQVAATCLGDSSPVVTSSVSTLPEPTYVVSSPTVSYSNDFLYSSRKNRAPPLT